VSVPFTWRSASQTHPGCVREINEDACLERPDIGLWVVADGMGGHRAGDVASRMIVESLRGVARHARPSSFVDDLEDRVFEVNRRLHEQARAEAASVTMGSTIVAVFSFERYALCLWAGDSRAYRLRAGALEQISRDHSQVEEMVEHGEIGAESAETHPLANVITRAVGGAEDLYLDLDLEELRDRDRYLLCSDGLYKTLSRAEIGELLARGAPPDACEALLSLSLERSAADNVTIAVIDFEQTDSEAEAAHDGERRSGKHDDNAGASVPQPASISGAAWTSSDKR
jgi:serine/threonine protein phosphatase PrpC